MKYSYYNIIIISMLIIISINVNLTNKIMTLQ